MKTKPQSISKMEAFKKMNVDVKAQKLIEGMEKIARKENRKLGLAQPVALIITGDDQAMMIPTSSQDEGKEFLSAMIRHFAQVMEAKYVIHCGEAYGLMWDSAVPYPEVRPSQHPDRKDIFNMTIECQGHVLYGMAPVTKKGIGLMEWHLIKPEECDGTFSNFINNPIMEPV